MQQIKVDDDGGEGEPLQRLILDKDLAPVRRSEALAQPPRRDAQSARESQVVQQGAGVFFGADEAQKPRAAYHRGKGAHQTEASRPQVRHRRAERGIALRKAVPLYESAEIQRCRGSEGQRDQDGKNTPSLPQTQGKKHQREGERAQSDQRLPRVYGCAVEENECVIHKEFTPPPGSQWRNT